MLRADTENGVECGGHTARPLLSTEFEEGEGAGFLSKLQAIAVSYGLS